MAPSSAQAHFNYPGSPSPTSHLTLMDTLMECPWSMQVLTQARGHDPNTRQLKVSYNHSWAQFNPLSFNSFSTIWLVLNLWFTETQRHFWHFSVKLRLLHHISVNFRLTAGLYIYSYYITKYWFPSSKIFELLFYHLKY